MNALAFVFLIIILAGIVIAIRDRPRRRGGVEVFTRVHFENEQPPPPVETRPNIPPDERRI